MKHSNNSSEGHGAALLAGFLGWTLDAFDFFLVVMALTAIAADFHKTDTDIAFAITLTLAFRPVGAFIFGLLADRYGRRLPLIIDLIFFSVVEVLSGLAPTYITCLVLAAVHLSRIADDDDELRFARHPGHVSDSVETSLAFQSSESCRDHGLHNDWRNCRWNFVWPFVGSLWSPALDDLSAVMRNSGNSAVGSFACAWALIDWRLPDAIHGARCMGSNPCTPV